VESRPVPLTPEIVIGQVPDHVGLWDSSDGAYHSDRPPPFWAFPWAGGQALARYVLDHPDTVRDRDVLDLGSGSGLVAIAAARAGGRVTACDSDPQALDAIRRNTAANGVTVTVRGGDALGAEPSGESVILVGDMFYGPTPTNRVMRFLRRCERVDGATALVGDPGRGFLLPDRFVKLAGYDVPVRAAVEDVTTMPTAVWRLRPVSSPSGPEFGHC
jgi:predicted nicotinamide N-methyase